MTTPVVKAKVHIASCMIWDELVKREMQQEYLQVLQKFIHKERETKEIFPIGKEVMNALKMTPFHRVCCVIIGQEPYHTPGASHGLAFSRLGDYRPLPLDNIFKEIRNDVFPNERLENLFVNNDLSYWARQGVLLLNRVLTVEKGIAASHKGKGWEQFTIEVIKKLNEHPKDLVYLLWGNSAKELKPFIDKRHLVLEAVHPSPKSAEQGGWFDKRHFSQANDFIIKQSGKIIFWHNNPDKYHI